MERTATALVEVRASVVAGASAAGVSRSISASAIVMNDGIGWDMDAETGILKERTERRGIVGLKEAVRQDLEAKLETKRTLNRFGKSEAAIFEQRWSFRGSVDIKPS